MTAASPGQASGPFNNTLARTGTLSFLLVMTGSALAFGTTLVVGNLLGEKATGTFFQISAFFAILTTLCTMGADTGLVRFLSAGLALGRPDDGPALLRIALLPATVASGLLALALWVMAPLLQQWLDMGPDFSVAVRAAAPFIVLGTVMTVYFGALRGTRQVVRFAVLQNITLPLLRLVGIWVVIAVGVTTPLLTGAWAAPVTVVVLLAALPTHRSIRATATAATPAGSTTARASGRPPTRSFWSFSSARGISAAIEVVLEWIGVLAVAALLGPAAAGVYGVVNRCVRLGTMLDHTARIVSGPPLSEAMAVGDIPSATKLFNSVTKLLVIGAWPLYLVFILFGAPILRFFGEGFDAGADAFAAIAAVMLLVVSAGGVQSLLLMSGRSRWQLINKATALTVAIVLNLTLIPLLGLNGAVIAWGAAALTDVCMAAVQVRVFLGIQTRLSTIAFPALLAFGVFGLGGWALRLATGPSVLGLVILCGAGGAIYLALLMLLKKRLGLSGLMRKPHLPETAKVHAAPRR